MQLDVSHYPELYVSLLFGVDRNTFVGTSRPDHQPRSLLLRHKPVAKN